MYPAHRPVRLGAFVATLLVALSISVLLAPPRAVAETTANAASRYDTLVLRDLGGRQAALVQLVAEDGTFAPRELWRSKKGAFDTRKATFVVGDVNADGIADGVALYDLGGGRSRLLVYPNDGFTTRQVTAWTSKPGAFAKAKAKLAVADLDRDGRDDLLALYDRGRSGVALYRFLSTGSRFRQSLAWSARSGLVWSKAQLAAGDVTGDGRGDGIVLYAAKTTRAQLLVFSGTKTKLTKKTFWSGAYTAARARLAIGDVDSDGDGDAVCLYRRPDNAGRLDVFLSSGAAFAGARVWYESGASPVPTASRFCVGDLTGDGRADALTAAAAGAQTRVTTWASSGSSFVPAIWLTSPWPYAKVRLGVAPSAGFVVSDKAEPLNDASLRYLRAVEPDGTLAFAGETGQLARLQTGDIVLAAAGRQFPDGLCRKVTSIGEQDGRIIVETTPAELSDVIDQGEIAFHMSITADDLPDDGIVAQGVRLIRDPAPPGTFMNATRDAATDGFGFTLTTTILGFAEAEGEVWLDPDAYCDWEIGWGGLESAYYTQVLNTSTDLTVSIKKDYTGTKEMTLYKRTLTAITIMVGPVPVVITPEFEVKVGVEGELVAGVTAGMSLSTETWATITYDDGWDFDCGSTHEWTPKPPQLFSELTVTGFASAGLAFELYGVAGPEATLKPYVELAADIDPAADPWWTLSAGLDGEIGIKVELLDTEVASREYTLHFFKFLIDQAGSATSGGGPSTYQTPSVRGKILDDTSGQPLRSASVEIGQNGSTLRQTSSAADGSYVFSGLSPGTYTVTAGKDYYADNSRSVVVVAGQTTLGQDISLTRYQYQGIRGHVFSDTGHYPLFRAHVELFDANEPRWYGAVQSDTTFADGSYEFTAVPPGNYEIVASAPYYHSETLTVTVGGGQMLENKDLFLVHYSEQGVYGRVVDSLSGDPVSGARVVAFEGGGEAGYFEDEAVTAADGSFFMDALEANGLAIGTHGLIVNKTGYVELKRDFEITRGEITQLGDIRLRPLGGLSMRSQIASCIRWPEGLPNVTGRGTYEFWFRPFALVGTEWGNQIAQVSYDYPDWQGGSLHRYPAMVIAANDVQVGGSGAYATVFVFTITENEWGGDPNEPGAYHTLRGTTPIVSGRWYHIAAQYGPSGMELYVNGHLEASNDYPSAPEPFDGATGGWFSLGENYLEGQGRPHTAGGDYKGLVVREWDYYEEDFTPYDDPSGSDALVYDLLHGMTNGENLGFVPTP